MTSTTRQVRTCECGHSIDQHRIVGDGGEGTFCVGGHFTSECRCLRFRDSASAAGAAGLGAMLTAQIEAERRSAEEFRRWADIIHRDLNLRPGDMEGLARIRASAGLDWAEAWNVEINSMRMMSPRRTMRRPSMERKPIVGVRHRVTAQQVAAVSPARLIEIIFDELERHGIHISLIDEGATGVVADAVISIGALLEASIVNAREHKPEDLVQLMRDLGDAIAPFSPSAADFLRAYNGREVL